MTPADRAALRSDLAARFVTLLAQGAWVEDVLHALRLAVRLRATQAQAERLSERRVELRQFYASADRVLAAGMRQLGSAGTAAKRAARL
jgi:hypothetical protein